MNDSFPTVCLSKASKMPCKSYSLPAETCKVGSKLRLVEGSTCSKCYARKGNYRFPNVKKPRIANYDHIMACKGNKAMREDWIVQMVAAVSNDLFFRWHDSGDLQGEFHLAMIVEVAKRAPWCKFWLPTREHGIVKQYVAKHDLPNNLTVRLSAHMMGKLVPTAPSDWKQKAGVVASSVAYTGNASQECPAYTRGGSCGDCRSCWDRNVSSVNYPLH